MSLPTKRLLLSVALLMACLAVGNLLILRSARSSQRHHLLTRLQSIPAATDCVFLGNSLVEAGCDVEAFQAAWPATRPPISPVNLALGATTPVEHCLILQHALERSFPIRYLIYGFFDDQLNAPPRGDWSDLLGNRALAYSFPDEAAALYAPGSRLKRWQLRLTHYLPMLAERSSLWGKVESLRRTCEEIGMPKHKVNRFGRVEDFAGLEPKDLDSFNRRCGAIVQARCGFSPPIRDLIRLAQQRGAQVILVEMPMPSRHRQLFYATPIWQQTRHYLQSLAQQQGVQYLAASDWISDDTQFEDATHLNEQGAAHFSGLLAKKVADVEGLKR